MKYRKLGRTKLETSIIGIGGGAFAGKEKTSELAYNVIKTSVEKGINLLETAEDYEEEKLSSAVKEMRNRIILVSKSFSSTKDEMKKSIEKSLKKLHTDSIDIYMMHTVDSIDSLNFRIKNGVLEALKEARKDGKINWIGITTHNISTAIEAVKTNEFDVIEVPYCIGAYETEKVFEYTKKYNVGVIAMRPLGGGILVDRSKRNKIMNVKNALEYVLSNENISCALIGMSSIEHAKENIKVISSLQLSKIKREEIEKDCEKILGKRFCRGCLICMPCKKHGWSFPIDQLMRIWTYYFIYKIDGALEEYKKISLTKKCYYCKECEKKCPYNIPIVRRIKSLENAVRRI
jgi:predicted aldo/keto reductase-like oxidoreductase